MSRRIQQGDIQIFGGKQSLFGKNSDTSLPLQSVGVQIGIAVVYPSQAAAAAAAIKERFRKGSLSRVYMGKQPYANIMLFVYGRHPLSYRIMGIIS